MPAATIAAARSATTPPRSSLTASQPASFTNRCAVATACSSDCSYDPNGKSPTSSGVVSPRRTAPASISISSTDTGTVDG
jgi:hypothetical protein